MHTWGLGLFLFTKASGPGMLLAPHLLLDALLAIVAKIVLSPSVSAQSPLPRALFCKPIFVTFTPVFAASRSPWCAVLDLDRSRVRWGRLWLCCFWRMLDRVSADGPGCCLISARGSAGSLGFPSVVGGCCGHGCWAGRLHSRASPNVILHGETPSLQCWLDCLTS